MAENTKTVEVKKLINRRKMLEHERRIWDEHWDEVNTYLMPRKANITVTRNAGDKVAQEKFSSVGGHAHEILSANLQGTLTSKSFRWFDMESPELPNPKEDRTIREWLNGTATAIWDEFNRSNFHSQSHEMYLDLTGPGTGCLLLEEKDGPINKFNGLIFTAHATGSYYIEEDADGVVNAICLDMWYTARQAIDKFGEDKVSDDIKNDAEKNADTKHHFIHWVMPREQRNKRAKNAINKPFASIKIEVKNEQIVAESGYDDFPYMVPRWSKIAGERYGRGPGVMALPDIKVLDKATELELNAWAKAIDPPYKVLDDGVMGDVDLRPGGATVVREMEAIAVMESGARWDVNRIKLDEYRLSIRQTFFADQLELPASGPQMTATEVQARFELMQRVLGPTLGRVETEFLDLLIGRAFRIMARKGALPEPPADLPIADIDVRYVGPLARAQRMSELTATQQWLEQGAALAQFDGQVLDNVNTDIIMQKSGDWLNIPAEFMRAPEAVQEIRDARAEQAKKLQVQQEKQAKAENMQAVASAAGAMRGGGTQQ